MDELINQRGVRMVLFLFGTVPTINFIPPIWVNGVDHIWGRTYNLGSRVIKILLCNDFSIIYITMG